MKKILLGLVLAVCFSTVSFAADDADIDQTRVVPDAVAMRLTAIRIDFDKNRAVIVYKEVDANNEYTGVVDRQVFENITDNPDTPEDETNMAFNKLNRDIVNEIVASQTAGDNARKSLKRGVKNAYVNP